MTAPIKPHQTGPHQDSTVPLAERMRPKTLDGFMGQTHLLGTGRPLRKLIEQDSLRSMILWGPPGSGKTTLARIIAYHSNSDFYQLSAVNAGVKDVREVISKAQLNRRHYGKRTILFIDEIHRFNKAQQDALLHSVEQGVITLIGATTENPSFEVISPLISRSQVYILNPLSPKDLESILDTALKNDEFLQKVNILLKDKEYLIQLSGGDARVMLNGLESAVNLAKADENGRKVVDQRLIVEAFQRQQPKYDKGGEEHYNIISAFIKSIRGGDPDAAVYWLARMLEGGEDPKFIARRMIVLASEDIGNADPYALTLATSCFTAVDYIGMPEAQIVLSHTATYLASCPKSNAAVMAIGEALADVRNLPNEAVPLHLRNAPTGFMKHIGYGDGYQYGHNYEGNFVEQEYLPENVKHKIYYHPTDNGREKSIRERLNEWWKKKKR
jgi:putative ATPase